MLHRVTVRGSAHEARASFRGARLLPAAGIRTTYATATKGILCMPRSSCLIVGAFACCTVGAVQAGEVGDHPEQACLQGADVVLCATSGLGGRVLQFGVRGMPNLIKVGDAVRTQPAPTVDAGADDIAYLGHDVWLGPQSGWWSDQDANVARRDAKANWPPDPYLAFAETEVVARSSDTLLLRGVESPVTGVQLEKRFTIQATVPATVRLDVTARNVRERPIVRDLWFNTRTFADARVYVPVANARDIRADTSTEVAAPAWRVERGMFRMVPVALPEGTSQRRGKLFVQPSAGWMAAFLRGQVFVLRFDHRPATEIHPEHGQVELYLDHGAEPGDGLLELEVHAPLRELPPAGRMQARESWTALPYAGEATETAELAFLCEVVSVRLGDASLCAEPSQ